ncbi:unnamed protein product [Psylliodes chrysocephalus]|uniref:Receptor ligand binding region domain-containing protein n=1 Tax=Psylliodes chrysocephalus TaxID=3402493 RepID=A0A9P0CY22_9CUCU|nr:unnamed protein product [Psylliodes chrysocephala]
MEYCALLTEWGFSDLVHSFVGAIFEQGTDDVQTAFKFAMLQHNQNVSSRKFEFQAYVDVINTADAFKLSRLICTQFSRGVFSMLGAVSPDSFDTLHSYSNTFQMPFVTPWFPEKVLAPSSGFMDYAVSMRPEYHKAIIDTVKYYGWRQIIYLYDSNDVLIYIKYWFQAPSACSAPRNDLELLKDLKKNEDVTPVIARKAINKVCGHLWYVSEELIVLSFFDDKVGNETKKKMVEALKKEGADFCPKRINVDIENIVNKNLDDFVTSLLRLQQIYQGLTPGSEIFQVQTVRRINNVSEALVFLRGIEEQSRWTNKYVVLDCSTETAKEIVVSHVRDISLGRRNYHYLLSGLISNKETIICPLLVLAMGIDTVCHRQLLESLE